MEHTQEWAEIEDEKEANVGKKKNKEAKNKKMLWWNGLNWLALAVVWKWRSLKLKQNHIPLMNKHMVFFFSSPSIHSDHSIPWPASSPSPPSAPPYNRLRREGMSFQTLSSFCYVHIWVEPAHGCWMAQTQTRSNRLGLVDLDSRGRRTNERTEGW